MNKFFTIKRPKIFVNILIKTYGIFNSVIQLFIYLKRKNEILIRSHFDTQQQNNQ